MSTITYCPAYGLAGDDRRAASARACCSACRSADRSRMRRPSVIRQHSHLLPRELEQAGWKITERSEDSLPFIR